MFNPSPKKTRLSKLRWYFGVVGVLGTLVLPMVVTEPNSEMSWRIMCGLGLLVTIPYIGCAVFFDRLIVRTQVLLGVLAGALCWLVSLIVLTVASGNANMVVPLVLFLVLPLASAAMSTDDLRRSA